MSFFAISQFSSNDLAISQFAGKDLPCSGILLSNLLILNKYSLTCLVLVSGILLMSKQIQLA
jgi:hypothetical protein